ncbi:MAG TPA: PH domain-containing protein [Nocardioidaceae bacterium]|nr:PH domain-containing protein [Nocardioidaceae bacterium]
MNDLFAPPGNTWRPVSPQLRRLRRVLLMAFTVVALAAVAVLARVFGWSVGWSVALAVVLLLLAVYGWWLIGRNVRNWGYAERDDDLYIKHGALFRELIAVPYGRMQFVDITAGPLEQLYGIASVRLHTASPRTSGRIPGLPADEAARLRDRLTELGESQAAGL